ncbi:hypothetical protein RFI_38408, partial [Reticulomyxa filosa]
LLFREEAVRRENARKQNEKSAVPPSLFRTDAERECWTTEQGIWCADMLEQWIWGGHWIEAKVSKTSTLLTFNLDKGPSSGMPEDKLGPKIEGLLLTGTQIVYNTTYRGSLRYRCYEVPIVKQGIQYILQALKNVNLVDNEGLRIIENDHCAMKYHSKYSNCIRQRYPRALLWKEIDTLKEYHDVMLHSRQAPRVLWRWYHYELMHGDENKSAITKRDELIEQLLRITKSAIHLRFVWKHLVRYRQELLEEFLDSGEAYRGVFYVRPLERFQSRAQREQDLLNDPLVKPHFRSALQDIQRKKRLNAEEAKKPD